MKLEKGKISGLELALLMTGFLFGSSVLIIPASGAEHEAWLAILLGLVEGLVLVCLYTALNRRFPGKNLVEIADVVYGRFLGKLISIAFIGYLFNLGSLVVTNYHDFIKLAILVQTPSSIVIFTALIVIIYGVKNGIEVLARCSQGMVITTMLLSLLISSLLITKIQTNNFRPLFSLPLSKILWAGHSAGTFPFGETVAFLMVFPFVKKSKEITGWALKGLLIAAFFFILASARTIGMLGKSTQLFIYPAFYAGRLINVADVFTRLEIIIAINFLLMGFLKTGVLLYGSSLGVAHLFKLKAYQPLVLPLGLLMGLLSLLNFHNVSENIEFATKIYPIYALPFQVGIPLLTLIVALIRKLPGEGK